MIDRAENLMYIDNAGIVGLSLASLPANVAIVTWDGVEGELEYNDAPAVRTQFNDPTPYLPMVDAWIAAAATASPALTLAQAKGIKAALVDQFYHQKRQLPITPYEANDEAVVGMLEVLCQPGVSTVAGFVSSYNLAATSHTAALNTSFSTHQLYLNASYVDVTNKINPQYYNFYAYFPSMCHGSRFTNVNGYDGPVITGPFNTWPPFTMPSYPAMAIPADTTVQWFQIGATAPTAMAFSTFVGLPAQVVSRRHTLQATRVTKQDQIAALATIAAVVSYSVTAGW
jgi:hypothetical protein